MSYPINALKMRSNASGTPSGTAPTFVGSKGIGYQNGAEVISLTDLLNTSGAAATLQQNDLVIISYANDSQGTNQDLAAEGPAGWTLETELFSNDTHAVNFAVWWKFMGATPDTSVTLPDGVTGSDGCAATIHAFRGVNTTTPRDATTVTAAGTNTPHPDPPAITPTTTNALIYVACGSSQALSGGGVYTDPGDLNSATNAFRSAFGPGTTDDATSGAGFVLGTGGVSFNPTAWPGANSSTLTQCAWASCVMALKPADA